ncbi:MAG: aldose 1-epimerase [Spirochaetaceae bacterium]|jgi:aldose 1-epimerase|nr:aldose 1-epimerase [Spirochaetaceae bacterium]
MFYKDNYKIGSISVCRIHNDGGTFIDIIPQLGAMVYQICLNDGTGNYVNILDCDSEEDFSENPWFRSRVLFPFNDRIPEGKYTFQGIEYQLPINNKDDGSALHGLVYNRTFTELSYLADENSAEITYSCSLRKNEIKSYPFAVTLIIAYKITNDRFFVKYTINNEDDRTLPVALGWHPYFCLSPGVDDLNLQTGGGAYIAVDDFLNPTGEILSVAGSKLDFTKPTRIGEQQIDIAFNSSSNGKTILESDRHHLEIYFDPRFFPFVQIFIPPDRNSIAIEPVTAATNSFNINGLGKLELKPGEEKTGHVEISLNRKA